MPLAISCAVLNSARCTKECTQLDEQVIAHVDRHMAGKYSTLPISSGKAGMRTLMLTALVWEMSEGNHEN